MDFLVVKMPDDCFLSRFQLGESFIHSSYKTTFVHYQLFTNFEIMASKSKVYFYSENVNIRLNGRKELKRVIEALFKKEGKELDRMNYVFCNDEEVRRINRQYLKHDYYTDIITFDLSEGNAAIRGESYISLHRIKANSLELKKSFNEELLRVIFHGALHLCEYDDKSEKKRLQMRKKEDYYISLII
jgi:probable rRNA maturation factor